jgi:putative intracellular protease/amidase
MLGALPLLGRYFKPFGDTVQALIEREDVEVCCDALPWRMPLAVIDGNVVTGWGPWTAAAFGRALLARLGAPEQRAASRDDARLSRESARA